MGNLQRKLQLTDEELQRAEERASELQSKYDDIAKNSEESERWANSYFIEINMI